MIAAQQRHRADAGMMQTEERRSDWMLGDSMHVTQFAEDWPASRAMDTLVASEFMEMPPAVQIAVANS
jgi:hypothetical protein